MKFVKFAIVFKSPGNKKSIAAKTIVIIAIQGVRKRFPTIVKIFGIAHQYGHGHTVILGVIFGMLIMAVSLLLF